MDQLTFDDVEIWLPIEGYELTYQISSLGRVWSAPRPSTCGGILKPTPDRKGYLYVALVQHGVQTRHYIHQLVAAAFISPRSPGEEVRHGLAGKTVNTVANLSYGTHSRNQYDQVEHGTHSNASKTHCPKGHPYDDENTLVRYGRRWCKECQRIAHVRGREREKLETGKTCSEPGCKAPAVAKGLCRKDYTRQWRATRTSA